jgi:hypothetical protein
VPRKRVALVIVLLGGALVVGLLLVLGPAVGLYFTVFAFLYGPPRWFGPTIFVLAWPFPPNFIIGLRVVRIRLQRRLPQD